ncbi:cytochrome c oxidase assembly protein [uncultured Phenylobacterium sp.]|uniref:cytochrome c oxidase assembly protein n=1 Tax=uncultured Phenylobacterium sp. TaxID=349273 RepID=UPI0025DA0DF6|nr:cytochrome c oxidase assembly protein [uncultured Phenylobacterium sp.]
MAASLEASVWTPYCGAGATPLDLMVRWNLDPVVIAGILALAAVLWRGSAPRSAWLALGLFAVIFVSPLCALSSALLTARTAHHVLLVAAVAPLAAWSLPPVSRSGLAAATLCAAAVFWIWHAPGAYAWALSNDAPYWLMQTSLFGTALWFWLAVRAARPMAAIAGLLVSTVQMGLLGALLTVAGRALYAPHAATTWAWGLPPLQDQQLAGRIMWAPAAAIYLVIALLVLGRLLTPPSASTA